MNGSSTVATFAGMMAARYSVEYFSGKNRASQRFNAQRFASFALSSLWPRLKSTMAYMESRLATVNVFVTAPSTFGVGVPTNVASAAAHATGGPFVGGPLLQRMLVTVLSAFLVAL